MKEELGRDLVAAAVLRGSFRLRSGATSSYYIDKYLFETQPGLLRRLVQALRAFVPAETQRLAGPVLGAVPLVTALALEVELPTLLVRPEKPKDYGTAKQIEGVLEPGDRVLLIEDVVTTGGAALASVEALRGAGAEVLRAVCVIDREEGGAAAFERVGVPFQALFTKSGLGL
jgi:orotate phosphoribosyltransferase